MENKSSHKFFKFLLRFTHHLKDMYKSHIGINKLSFDVWFVRIGQYLVEILKSEGAKNN